MSDPLFPLDLKFLPDWLKEAPAANPYANHAGESSDRRDGPRGSRPPRQGGGGRDSGGRGTQGRGPGDRRPPGNQGPRQEGPRGRGGARPGGPQRGARGDHRDRPQQQDGPDQRGPRPGSGRLPAEIRIEFLPEPNAASHIARQIRQSAKAYPLFGTARMFLEKPERHIARITSKDAAHPLHQLEDGPISFDANLLERDAFRNLWSRYYKEEVLTTEPPKGNYTSVARCRSTGQFLGPTSHHAYQVAVRKLYEERFSRFMSFLDFQREEIEVVASEQAVEDWKNQASRSTVYTTLDEADPKQFKSLAEAESHFRKTHLPGLIKSGLVLQCSGKAVREMYERGLTSAAREAFDKELAYPSGIVNGLRHFLNEEGLHVFKHRKRVLYVSSVRPKRADSSKGFAEGPATLLTLIGESPRIAKRDLAIKVLGSLDAPVDAEGNTVESPELTARKTQLAADLHYLVHAGHVLEFADGKLDLPLSPNQQAAADADQRNPEPDEVEDEAEEKRPVTAHSGHEPVSVEQHSAVEPPVVETAPVDVAPVDVAPVDVAPVDVAPVDVAPVDVAPVDVAPVEVAPVEVAPVEVAPVEVAPVDVAPVDVAPVDAAPVAGADPAPELEPAEESAPELTPEGSAVQEAQEPLG